MSEWDTPTFAEWRKNNSGSISDYWVEMAANHVSDAVWEVLVDDVIEAVRDSPMYGRALVLQSTVTDNDETVGAIYLDYVSGRRFRITITEES